MKMNVLCLAGLFLLLIASGCGNVGLTTPIPAATPAPTSGFNVPVSVTEIPATETPIPPSVSENDECGNPYYPVVNGAQWIYQVANGVFTHSLSAGDNGAFTIAVKSGENTFIIEGLCLEGGDINLLEVPGVSLIYTGGAGSSTITTTSNEGVTLPGDIQQGDDWSQAIGLRVNSGNLVQDYMVETTYNAVGYEPVTVLAGTFHALKIVQSTSMGGGNSTVQTLWYVDGVGLVKSQIDLDVPVVSELVSYSIP